MLGVKLHAEERQGIVDKPFVGLVVGIGEEDVPARRDGVVVNSEAVVLGGDETALGGRVDAGLVVTTIAIPVCARVSV